MEDMLGDAVLVSDSAATTSDLVEWLVSEPEQRDRFAHRGYRLVHRDHTYSHRMDALLAGIGLETDSPQRTVTAICVSNRPEQASMVIKNLRRQTYPHLDFVFVANSDAYGDDVLSQIEAEVPGCRSMRMEESATLGECLNAALETTGARYFAKFDDDDHYGPEYLTDVMLTFPYTGAAVAGKQSYYAYLSGTDQTVLRFPDREFRDAPRVVGGTIVADRDQVGHIKFEAVPRGTDTRFLEAVKARGLTIFSADRFNFCQVRAADPSRHTWPIEEAEFLKACSVVGPGLQREAIFV
jgi:hypothetical protein